MPYSKAHKQQVRSDIVESARILFNRHGFEKVTIDQVMEMAGLTRGGFYNHFSSKDELFEEAIAGFLMGRGEQWRQTAGVNVMALNDDAAERMIKSYLSPAHLHDIDGQCPMIALPSDVARGNESVRASYQKLLEGMVYLFENSLPNKPEEDQRKKSLSMAALCVGGMILARTLPDSELAKEVQEAAHDTAMTMCE